MAQRRTTAPPDNTPDYLVKPKAQFELELSERIKMGDDFIATVINSGEEFTALRSEYSFWHDFNRELLKRAFNKTDNQYFKEYIWEPAIQVISTSMYSRTPSFDEIVADFKGDIYKYLNRLKKIKGKLILIDELPGLQPTLIKAPDKQTDGLRHLSNLFSKFHKIAQHLRHRHADRETLIIKDEYDVQDLLGSLLRIDFDDIRPEDYAPSYAGGNSRVDFALKAEKIIVEVKMTNDHLKDKEIGSQLLIDIGRYRHHPDCEHLVVFVYDRLDNIRNKSGLISDLEKMSSSDLKVRVFIEPR